MCLGLAPAKPEVWFHIFHYNLMREGRKLRVYMSVSTWALGGVSLQSPHTHAQVCMHAQWAYTQLLSRRTSEPSTAPSQGNCSSNMTIRYRHFLGLDSFSPSSPIFLLFFAVLPYTPNSTVINLLLGRCLLTKGPVYFQCNMSPPIRTPPHQASGHCLSGVSSGFPSPPKITQSWPI